jgi:hypothetical protein
MPIEIRCVCGTALRVRDQDAGKHATCPACRRDFVIAAKSGPSATIEDLPDSAIVGRRWWNDPVIVVGAAIPSAILLAFFGYLVGSRREPATAPPATAHVQGETSKPTRNPKIPIELSYPVIKERFNPPRSAPLFPVSRLVDIRLNMKVSEEVLREICLEIKAKETAQFEFTRISFWLPGRGPHAGGGSPWAVANFDEGPSVQILGFTIEQEKFYRTDPLILPAMASDIGIWLIDDGTGSHQIVIYRIDDEWRYHFRERDEAKQKYISLKELPDHEGRCLQPTDSTDRYILLPNGDLKLYSPPGMLLHHVSQQSPTPPIQRTTHQSAKLK